VIANRHSPSREKTEMNFTTLVAAAAVAGLTSGAAQAATTHHHVRAQSAGAYAQPAQPIAYSNIDAYMKASPKQRASRDWSTAAATGSSVNAAAETPAQAAPAAEAAPAASAAPDAQAAPAAPQDQAAPVNPPATAPAAPAQ
jgi:hypothetical protein